MPKIEVEAVTATDTADMAEIDDVMEAVAKAMSDPEEDDELQDDPAEHSTDSEIFIQFPKEAMALYGVSGVAVSTSWIIQCLSGQLEAEDAQLFAGLREDFYFNGCDRSDYVLERMGISASIEERAKLRLEIQRKKEAYWAAVASEVVGVDPGRDVLWRPYLAEREQLNQEYDALGSRWVILEQKYVDLLKEQDPFGKDHHEREEATRTALQKEYENLQVDNGEWDRRYAELLDKVHSDANYDRIIEETRKSLHELETRENKVRLRRQGQEALVPPGR